MKITVTGDTTTVDFLADGSGGRQCGGCTLCCKLVPVAMLGKKAGDRCQHQRSGKGCAIYDGRPFDCRTWACRWLASRDDTGGMKRPDRAHYVIDMMPDQVRMTNNETGEIQLLEAVQVWLDPAFPAARHDPALRAFMHRSMQPPLMMPTLLRWNSREAICVFPPVGSIDGEWYETGGECSPDIGRWSRLPPERRPPW